jgi:isoquinoline 1-oxidoreductase subunit alpha
MPTFTLNVNGKLKTVDAQEGTPLLWVLRDQLGLTGTKYGCGHGLCGACTVHIDGEATRSCVTPIDAVGGKKIVTIEGLTEDVHQPLIRAWVEDEVPQCGYCQPGQIMTAAALLAHNPHPTEAEIAEAMTDTLCRCGTQTRIRRAIHHAIDLGGKR